MVLADAEGIEPDLIRQRDLLEQVAQALPGAARAARVRVRPDLRERIDADLHEVVVAAVSVRDRAAVS